MDGVAIVDFGFDVRGTLLFEDDLSEGSEVTVYAVRFMRRTQQVYLSRRPLLKPLLPLRDVIADGQTAYMATVVGGKDMAYT